MKSSFLNYDKIANEYNQRYPSSEQWERGRALIKLARQIKAQSILEVGSGTGYWLTLLNQEASSLYGLDFSFGMLQQARKSYAPLKLSNGTATQLPYQSESFDLIYCVDAIHHFVDHQAFIEEAFRVLRPGGALAIIGHDPHEESTAHWYIYDYFDDVYDTDIRRYPSGQCVMNGMKRIGFQEVSSQIVEYINNVHMGEAVFKDPFLKHNATSQLALLSDEKYDAGLQRIQRALEQAKLKNERIAFRSEIFVKMFLGFKRS